jgi:DNA-binding transcriptional MocR family regulator
MHRAEYASRAALALAILGDAAERPPNASATHLWLPLDELGAERAAARALREGVEVTSASAPLAPGEQEHGLRVCLGAARSRQALEEGLRIVLRALSDRAERALDSV